MARSTNLTSGRPDSKQENIISLKGCNGLASHSLMYSKDDYVLPRDTFGLMSGEAVVAYIMQRTTFSPSDYLQDVPEDLNLKIGDKIKVSTYETNLQSFYTKIKSLGSVVDGKRDIQIEDTYNRVGGEYVIIQKQHPQLLTYGEKLDSEGLQNPANWSSSWKSHLASGNVTALIPNLVDDQGNSNLPDDVKTVFKMTKKMKEGYGVLASQDNGATWLKSGTTAFNDEYTSLTYDYVNNTITFGVAPAVGDLIVADQSSWATPYTQLDPQKITKVEPKSIATNSHSVYKDALITWLATGKIATGNGSNGYESKYLESAEVKDFGHLSNIKIKDAISYASDTYFDVTIDGAYFSTANENIGGVGNSSIGFIIGNDGTKYDVNRIVYITPSRTVVGLATKYGDVTSNLSVGLDVVINGLHTTPQHSTHVLDNSNSSACKYFEVEFEFADGSKGEGVITQEMIYNETDTDYGDDTGDFGNLTNGTDTDLLAQTIKTGFFGRRK